MARRIQPVLEPATHWRLTAEGSGTRLTLTHEGFNLDSPLSRRAFEGMKPGWPAVLTRLDALLDQIGLS